MTPPITRRGFLTSAAAAALVARRAVAAGGDEPVRLVAAPGRAGLAAPDYGETDVWSYGSVPGPEIRVRAGGRVRVLVENRLPEPTTVHWHGIRIDNAMDGVPNLTQAPVEPGGTFLYDFVAPDAGTYWYHSHFRSYEQVARGLYGPLVVTGDESATDARDVTLMVDDWRLDDAGQIDAASFGAMMDLSHGGRLGNWLTVNGRSEETVRARPGERLRLRLASTANARIMRFDLGALDASIVALDGWPLDEPRRHTGPLELAPAQRVDIIVDLPDEPGAIEINEVSTGEPLRAATIDIAGAPVPPNSNNRVLAPRAAPALDLGQARRIALLMEGGAMGRMAAATHRGRPVDGREMMRLGLFWAFNGELRTLDEPLVSVAAGETVVVGLDNRTVWPHAMHLHGHHMRVVARNGAPVSEAEWRDTVLTLPDERLDLAFVADRPGKWLFHCHMLEHAASGMSTWIEIT